MYDYAALAAQAVEAGVTGDRIPAVKAGLPIVFVLEHYGHTVEAVQGKYVTRCPFHDDADPSLDVYGEKLERWGCYPCGKGGDVIDLVQEFEGTSFGDAIEMAWALLLQVGDWSGPTEGTSKAPFDFEAARATVEVSELQDPQPFYDYLGLKVAGGQRAFEGVDPAEVVEAWRLGTKGDRIIIPFYDRSGALVTYKWRTAGTKPMSVAGSRFGEVLYGEWRDTDPTRTVVLTEGESDAWAADADLDGSYVVLGLPSGATTTPGPKQVEPLTKRRVILAFDGDDAGRKGTLRWYAALVKVGADVEIASLPDGADLASLASPGRTVRGSRPVPAAPSSIREQGDAYVRPGEKVNVPLSNWRLDLHRELHGEQGTAYEGVLLPGGDEVVIDSATFSTATRLHAWAQERGRVWLGSDKDARTLLQLLQAEGPFAPQGRMTSKIGLYGGRYVWPGGQTGEDHWRYVEPPNAVPDLAARLSLRERPADPLLPALLRDLHEPRVMDPMLAWLAAAPLRPLMREYPVLAVTGSAGYGKTTLLETMLPLFSGALITVNLTGTTRFALESYLTCSNAFPVWVDEYRPGARKDTLAELAQLLRDAYTAQASTKGGMQERWSALTSLTPAGPIIVSGEDAFMEKSHVERMVLLSLPRDGRNPEALAAATDRLRAGSGFALGYLRWLLTSDDGLPDRIPTPAPYGPEDLPPRMRTNLGILRYGWNLLGNYMRDQNYIWPDAPDLSLVIGEAAEAATEDPILEAIRLALEGNDPAAWDVAQEQGGLVYVRTQPLVSFAGRAGLPLPGASKAVQKYLEAVGGELVVTRVFGKQARAVALPAGLVH